MKKILVLGALSLFCLSNASATQLPVARFHSNVVSRREVQKYEGNAWKNVSSDELKTGGFYFIRLGNLVRKDIEEALVAISCGGKLDLRNTIPDDMKLPLEQQYLYILESLAFANGESLTLSVVNMRAYMQMVKNSKLTIVTSMVQIFQF